MTPKQTESAARILAREYGDGYEGDTMLACADTIAALRAEIGRLRGDIRFMVEKAAAEHRPAYDEQQREILSLTTRLEALREAARAAYDLLFKMHRGNVLDWSKPAIGQTLTQLREVLPTPGEAE